MLSWLFVIFSNKSFLVFQDLTSSNILVYDLLTS